MKKFLNIIIVIVILAGASLELQAVGSTTTSTSAGKYEKIGAAGSQFLKIAAGARGNAMGGAFCSVTNDLTSITWNPAGLADIKTITANFAYTQWFANFSHNFAAMSLPLGEAFTFAAHVISFGTGKAELTTLEKPEGTNTFYSIADLSVGFTIAGYLTDQFSFGVTAKYVTNSFTDLSSNGIAFDIGTMYETGIQGIKLGFAIMNLGTPMTYTGSDLNTTKEILTELNSMPLDAQYLSSSYNMPIVFRAGISSMIIEQDEHKLLASGDFLTFSDVPEEFALGVEYTWENLISLRGGYLFGHSQLGLAGGIGINYVGGGIAGQIDYSISPTADLGLVNRISVNLSIE